MREENRRSPTDAWRSEHGGPRIGRPSPATAPIAADPSRALAAAALRGPDRAP